ncbi:MAG: LptA/OstA family protein [Armatimonadota bacterium]|nr:LptA/OstA family protein [Armatimonadota bacterium]
MRWGVVAAAVVLMFGVELASAQPAPVTIDAETITYDAAQRTVTARGNVRVTARRYRAFADMLRYDLRTEEAVLTGRVRVLDDRGAELRGQSLTLNTRTEEGVLEPAEGIVDRQRRIYLRGARLEVSPRRYVTSQSLVTSCDPRNPTVLVTANRIEVVPDEAIVAYDASIYLGGRRLYSTSRFEASLVPGEESVLIPTFGGNAVDGYWVEGRWRVRLPWARGVLQTKYGTTSGLFPLLRLAHRQPGHIVSLRLGRTQTVEERQAFNLIGYEVAEASASRSPAQIGTTPFSWSVAGAVGWFREQETGVAATRLDAQAFVESRPIALGPRVRFTSQAGFRISSYGSGDVRTVTTFQPVLGYQADPVTRVSLGYSLVGVQGRTPLRIDDVEPANTLSLDVARTVTDRYRLAAGVSYNLDTQVTKYSALAAVVVSPSLDFAVHAVYNVRLNAFEDVDYAVRFLCDCLDAVVRYRQMRREISIELGLTGFVERRGLAPRSTPPAVFPDGTAPGGEGGGPAR